MSLNVFYTAEICTSGVERSIFKAAFKFGSTISDYIAGKQCVQRSSVTYRNDLEEELYA